MEERRDGVGHGPGGGCGPNALSRVPQSLTRFGDRLLFTAEDPAHGRELWAERRHGPGTAIVVDARSGPADGVGDTPRITPGGTRVFFVANDGVHGSEPWVVEGASARMVADVRPGPAGSAPRAMVALGGVLVSGEPGFGGRAVANRRHAGRNVPARGPRTRSIVHDVARRGRRPRVVHGRRCGTGPSVAHGRNGRGHRDRRRHRAGHRLPLRRHSSRAWADAPTSPRTTGRPARSCG